MTYIDRCPHTLATGTRCLGSRLAAHDHFDAHGTLEPDTYDVQALDFDIWTAEADLALRFAGVDPDDACPCIWPFEPAHMGRA